jgi:hypothetical protein
VRSARRDATAAAARRRTSGSAAGSGAEGRSPSTAAPNCRGEACGNKLVDGDGGLRADRGGATSSAVEYAWIHALAVESDVETPRAAPRRLRDVFASVARARRAAAVRREAGSQPIADRVGSSLPAAGGVALTRGRRPCLAPSPDDPRRRAGRRAPRSDRTRCRSSFGGGLRSRPAAARRRRDSAVPILLTTAARRTRASRSTASRARSCSTSSPNSRSRQSASPSAAALGRPGGGTLDVPMPRRSACRRSRERDIVERTQLDLGPIVVAPGDPVEQTFVLPDAWFR